MMTRNIGKHGAALALLIFSFTMAAAAPLRAQTASPSPESREQQRAETENWVRSLKYETGTVSLGDGLATAKMPPAFKYLNPADSEKLMVLFDNPPAKNLGIIFPREADVLSDAGAKWFIVLQYQDEGHVKDDDAQKIDYTKLLKEMQEGAQEANKEREKQGYEAIQIVGWAKPPRYDEATHKLYWAKEIKFGGQPENTLNYNIRMLGRTGVLVLNAVSSMSDLPAIEEATPEILQMVDFNDGKRYADFQPSSDRMAEYGIAALVVGGIAAKAGLFKTLLVAVLALKKFVIIGAVALYAGIKKFVFGAPRKPEE